MCGKLITSVQQLDIDDSLRVVIADLIEAVRISKEVQEEVHNRYKDRKECSANCSKESQYGTMWDSADFLVPTPAANTVSNNSRKKLSGGLVPMSSDRGTVSGRYFSQQKPAETEEEKKLLKFGEAIKDAEQSTLCFNLDMGNVPIMNKHSISEKASLALTRMTAAVEGKNRGQSPVQTGSKHWTISRAWLQTWSCTGQAPSSIKVRTPLASVLSRLSTSLRIGSKRHLRKKH
jgi:hypothetical protein